MPRGSTAPRAGIDMTHYTATVVSRSGKIVAGDAFTDLCQVERYAAFWRGRGYVVTVRTFETAEVREQGKAEVEVAA